MRKARMLGNYVDNLAQTKGLSLSDLGSIIGCTENQVYAFLKGRAYATFPQLSALADHLGKSVEDLLLGDGEIYGSTVVHCMNDFENADKREDILDLIDHYIDIVDAVAAH